MENYSGDLAPSSSLQLAAASETQLSSISKWTKFIGVVFVVFGSVLLFATVLLAASFSSLMEQVVQVNGIEKEMIDMLEKGGKYLIGFALLVSAAVLVINGILLYRFGNYSRRYLLHRHEAHLSQSFAQLKKYLCFSFIMGVISAILSLISTFVFFGSAV